jgi:hypothetical protein
MAAPKSDSTVTPPYPPWPTFKGFFATLKNTAIPPQIDSSVMSRMSGSAQQQVRAALSFFGLVGITGNVQPDLRVLVNAIDDEAAWKDAWTAVFFDHYNSIIGDLDLDSATLKQLVDCFRDRGGVTGSVLRKALRFYLDGLAATGSTFSPHFKQRGLSAIAGDRKSSAKQGAKQADKAGAKAKQQEAEHAARRASHDGHGRSLGEIGPDDFVIKLPGRDAVVIPLPHGLSDAEWQYISAQVLGYMQLRKTK